MTQPTATAETFDPLSGIHTAEEAAAFQALAAHAEPLPEFDPLFGLDEA